MSALLLGARIVAAAVLPAVVMLALASDDIGGGNVDWVLYLVPFALFAVVVVGWLDGVAGVAVIAVWCGLIFAVGAYVERDDRPLPLCETLMDFGCKNDANPEDGIGVAIMVLVGGGTPALIAAGTRALYAPK